MATQAWRGGEMFAVKAAQDAANERAGKTGGCGGTITVAASGVANEHAEVPGSEDGTPRPVFHCLWPFDRFLWACRQSA